MIDLHIHTTYSDGSDSVKQVLEKAERLKLDLISITDHNNVDANIELLRNKGLRNIFSGKMIPGCEVLSVYEGNFVEVLSYVKDIKKFKKTLVNPFYIESTILFKFIQASRKIGLELDYSSMIHRLNEGVSPAIEIFVGELIKNPEYTRAFGLQDNPLLRFYSNFYLNPTTPFYIDERVFFKNIKQVVEDVHKCGGVSVLAHPFQYPSTDKKDFIEDIVSNVGIDGIECEYPKFNEEERNFLKYMCRIYGKFMSGGSDYHGSNRISNSMSTGINNNLAIPYDMVSEWTKPLERVLVNKNQKK